ncbi:MAG: sensor domain-containing diguanylate cyclase [Treponema sp.]|nr:sensor domain-containing diguanylate cyclase [Treponema sp.]
MGVDSVGTSKLDYEKQIYDLNQMLLLFRSLSSTFELSKLIESILYTTMAQMRVTGAGMFILDPIQDNAYEMGDYYINVDPDPIIVYSIPRASPLIEKLEAKPIAYTMQEVKAMIPGTKEARMLDSLNPTLLIPFVTKKKMNGLLFLGEHLEFGGEFSAYDKKQIEDIASLAAITVNNASLLEISSTDMTTHLKFKYYFFNVLSDRLEEALASNVPVSVLMFDIDFFKSVNDSYGHACGDYILEKVAHIIKKSIRSRDLASRYGGEEFTIMLNKTTSVNAVKVAERIRHNIEQYDFIYNNKHLRITLSGGVTTFSAEENPAKSANLLVDQADRALYFSKEHGRNCVTFADAAILASIEHHKEGFLK